jgi:hypothetical protein
MRAFAWVFAALAAVIVLAFVFAGRNGAADRGPLRSLPPELVAGARVEGLAAQQAFAAWLAAVPSEPVVPMHVRFEAEGRIAPADGVGAASRLEFTLELTFADPDRGIARLDFALQASGENLLHLSAGLLADGESVTCWGDLPGESGDPRRRGAFSVQQAVVSETWRTLGTQLPGLLQLSGLQIPIPQDDLPESWLLMLHPNTWMLQALRASECTGISLEGDRLLADLRLRSEALPRQWSAPLLAGAAEPLLASAVFDARSGILTNLILSGPATFTLRAADFAFRAPPELFRVPDEFDPADMTPMAQLILGRLPQAAGGADRGF